MVRKRLFGLVLLTLLVSTFLSPAAFAEPAPGAATSSVEHLPLSSCNGSVSAPYANTRTSIFFRGSISCPDERLVSSYWRIFQYVSGVGYIQVHESHSPAREFVSTQQGTGRACSHSRVTNAFISRITFRDKDVRDNFPDSDWSAWKSVTSGVVYLHLNCR